MANTKKYYAVVKGRVPGIYTSWDECKKQVEGFSGAVYKSFPTKEEAKQYSKNLSSPNEFEEYIFFCKEDFLALSIMKKDTTFAFVDGSFLENVGYASGAVMFCNGNYEEYSEAGRDPKRMAIRNVAGEIEAARHVIDQAIYNESNSVVIFYDYSGIEMWGTGAWKANNEMTQNYANYVSDMSNLVDIKFCKVGGHTGVPLNDRADSLAKCALGLN